MNDPVVSIVMPSYNREPYLKAAIESCLDQTYKNFELIIVENASKDNSLEIIKTYINKDNRIKLIQNKVDKSLPTNLNLGFSVAKGKYFTWISDDNLFTSQALNKLKTILDENPNIGLVYSDYTLINEEGKIGKYIYQEDPEFLPIRDCVGASFMYKKEIADNIGKYNENMPLVEDYEYWLRMGLHTKLYHIKESLFFL